MTLGIAPATKASFAGPMPGGYCQSRGSQGPPRARDKWAATVSPGKENLGRYKIYIFKVTSQGHPGVNVDVEIMSIMNSFVDGGASTLACQIGDRRAIPHDLVVVMASPGPADARHQRSLAGRARG